MVNRAKTRRPVQENSLITKLLNSFSRETARLMPKNDDERGNATSLRQGNVIFFLWCNRIFFNALLIKIIRFDSEVNRALEANAVTSFDRMGKA